MVNKKDWVLRKQVDTIHMEYYDVDEVEILRRKLIEDIDFLDCTEANKQDKWELIEEVLEIIDKRFGVK